VSNPRHPIQPKPRRSGGLKHRSTAPHQQSPTPTCWHFTTKTRQKYNISKEVRTPTWSEFVQHHPCFSGLHSELNLVSALTRVGFAHSHHVPVPVHTVWTCCRSRYCICSTHTCVVLAGTPALAPAVTLRI